MDTKLIRKLSVIYIIVSIHCTYHYVRLFVILVIERNHPHRILYFFNWILIKLYVYSQIYNFRKSHVDLRSKIRWCLLEQKCTSDKLVSPDWLNQIWINIKSNAFFSFNLAINTLRNIHIYIVWHLKILLNFWRFEKYIPICLYTHIYIWTRKKVENCKVSG